MILRFQKDSWDCLFAFDLYENGFSDKLVETFEERENGIFERILGKPNKEMKNLEIIHHNYE